MNLTDEDLSRLKASGIPEKECRRQWELFRTPPPAPALEKPCTRGDGIRVLSDSEKTRFREIHSEARRAGRFGMFIPASGASSRLFQAVHEVTAAPGTLTPEDLAERARRSAPFKEVRTLLDGLPRLAAYAGLREALRKEGKDLDRMRSGGLLKEILTTLLQEWDRLPKGLIPFHRYGNEVRTAFEEHLGLAAAILGDRNGVCRVHLTVSPETRSLFEENARRVVPACERRCGCRFEIGFSPQAESTQTIALDEEGNLFRLPNGDPLLRPGGHGALLENLGRVRGDAVFILNLDNVVPETRRAEVEAWKEILGGCFVDLERRAFEVLERLENDGEGKPVQEAEEFLRASFAAVPGEPERKDLRRWCVEGLGRPIRVCAMVPNEGEPGGGPFWVRGPDGKTSLQIVEKAEIEGRPELLEVFNRSTHFNPVDIVAGLKDRHGDPFDLVRFGNAAGGFLCRKSYAGRPLRCLERPGLWNGGMAGWNTVFIEAPLSTFNPVKTITDLLKPSHQP